MTTAQQITTANIAFNVNVKNFKTKTAKNMYAITYKRLLNDFKQSKISLQEFAKKTEFRYTQLMAKYK